MQVRNAPIHRLQLSEEIRERGYTRPDSGRLEEIAKLGPLYPCIVTKSDSPNSPNSSESPDSTESLDLANSSNSSNSPHSTERFDILAHEDIWFAAQELGLHDIPITEVFPSNAEERREYVQRDQVEDPITQAKRFRDWLAAAPKRKKTHLARIEGCTRSSISHQIRLLKLEPAIQLWIRSFELSSGHGRELLKSPAGEGRVKTAELAVQNQWSVRELRRHLTAACANGADDEPGGDKKLTPMADTPTKPSPTVEPPVLTRQNRQNKQSKKDANTQRLEQRLSDLLGSSVELDVEQGALTINYAKNLDVLDGVLRKIGYRD